jgi:energy-coupling factor transporter ATP-binding protein EcfA2
MLLSPATNLSVKNFLASPSHALLLVGPSGSGKSSLARTITEKVLGIQEFSFDNYAYGMIICPGDGKTIGIDSIRRLEHFLALRVPSSNTFNRAVVIEDAHALTIEAQNSLLKTLEEPPKGTFICLTTVSDKKLLPTIDSRLTKVHVQPPDISDLKDFFISSGYDHDLVEQAGTISSGLPGLMHNILSSEGHELTAATSTARELLSKPAYERLLMVDSLAKQRSLIDSTLFILQQMAVISLCKTNGRASKRWQAILTSSYNASKELSLNGQTKLVLTKLMLTL